MDDPGNDGTEDWLRQIAHLLEASGQRDWLDVSQFVVGIVGTLATVAVAWIAAYIAWKAHVLARATSEKQEAADRRSERISFVEAFREYLRLSAEGWTRGESPPFAKDGYVALGSQMLQLRGSDGAGAFFLLDDVNAFETKAEGWDRTDDAQKFGEGIGLLTLRVNDWARRPEGWLKERVEKVRKAQTPTE